MYVYVGFPPKSHETLFVKLQSGLVQHLSAIELGRQEDPNHNMCSSHSAAWCALSFSESSNLREIIEIIHLMDFKWNDEVRNKSSQIPFYHLQSSTRKEVSVAQERTTSRQPPVLQQMDLPLWIAVRVGLLLYGPSKKIGSVNCCPRAKLLGKLQSLTSLVAMNKVSINLWPTWALTCWSLVTDMTKSCGSRMTTPRTTWASPVSSQVAVVALPLRQHQILTTPRPITVVLG